ncbi:MAG: hypothetical protein COA42_12530, partial [Alteromonadaceae bacterium]
MYMNTSYVQLNLKHLTIFFIACISTSLAHSEPGRLSKVPLFLGNVVQPNILLLIDDSGSMDREVVKRNEAESVYATHAIRILDDNDNLISQTWYFVDYTPIDLHPSLERADQLLELCSGYNAMAYDPNKIYTPWIGRDQNGNDFQDQAINSALNNPYRANSTSIDLISIALDEIDNDDDDDDDDG